MREEVAKVLDDDDHEFAELLYSLGVNRNVAKVITYLAVAGDATSKDIERGSGLRQPEVSIAMRTLRSGNWVREWEIKTEAVGRPSKVFALSMPVDEIIKLIEEERRNECTKAMERIQKLRKMASF